MTVLSPVVARGLTGERLLGALVGRWFCRIDGVSKEGQEVWSSLESGT